MPFSFSAADLRGGTRLAAEAVAGTADLVEAVHATIARPLSRSPRTRGLTGWIYRLVRWSARRIGKTVEGGLAAADALGLPADGAARDTVVAALNGVLGDHLAASRNPLATPMQVRYHGRPLAPSAAAQTVVSPSSTLLVQVHGVCMHDGQWGRGTYDPGAVVATALDATRLAVRYNSGRHISDNGCELASLLEATVEAWPVSVQRVIVLGHSMGGLVARSAFHHACEAAHTWAARNAALVTLGSPHHGAPLERLGNGIDAWLEATRWTAPFARLGQLRSAGITDLRFGNVQAADWSGRARFARSRDPRQPLPLPRGVACYAVAATTGDGQGGPHDQALGDGLVPLASALGHHADPLRALHVPPSRQWVGVGMTHFDLLHRPEVTAQLLAWLAPA